MSVAEVANAVYAEAGCVVDNNCKKVYISSYILT